MEREQKQEQQEREIRVRQEEEVEQVGDRDVEMGIARHCSSAVPY